MPAAHGEQGLDQVVEEVEEQQEHEKSTSDASREARDPQLRPKPYDPAVNNSLPPPETDDNFKLTQAPETPSGILGAVKGVARRVTRTLSKASLPTSS